MTNRQPDPAVDAVAVSRAPFTQGRMTYSWSEEQFAESRPEHTGLLGGDPHRRPGHDKAPEWSINQPFVRALMADAPEAGNRIAYREFLAAHALLEIEIGVGRGDFLLARAARLPDRGFLGFEVKTGAAAKLVQRIAVANLSNLWISDDDARFGMPLLCPEGTMEAIHILFPDPWWKPGHVRRRLFTPAFMETLARQLRPGGMLHVRSDVPALLDSVRFLASASGRFVADGSLQASVEPYSPTHREEWCADHGLQVHTAFFRRIEDASQRDRQGMPI